MKNNIIMTDQCSSVNPTTNNQCTMSTNHFGPHKIGDVYSPTEQWVTKCSSECVFHSNSDLKGNRWEECINCGDKKELRTYKMEYIVITDGRISTKHKYNVWSTNRVNTDNGIAFEPNERVFSSDDINEFLEFMKNISL